MWASDDLKGDREIVLIAVSQAWQALWYASDDLKGDQEIVLIAVSQCEQVLVDERLFWLQCHRTG